MSLINIFSGSVDLGEPDKDIFYQFLVSLIKIFSGSVELGEPDKDIF